jgi:glc operon protein GlcG
MRMRPTLTQVDVRAMMAAARDAAERRALEVSFAVVDDAGVLLSLERLDGARLHTPDAARMKAYTAAIVRSSTADLQTAVRNDPTLLAFPGRLPVAGGLPVLHGGVVVGGVGSSGGSPEDDLHVCSAMLAALGG